MPKEAPRPAQLSEEFVQESGDEDSPLKSESDGNGGNGGNPSDGQDGESSDSDSTSASRESSASASRKRPRNTAPVRSNTTSKRQKRSTMRIPSKPFRIPTGFEPLNRNVSTEETEVLEAFGDLDGKQVWHISAPASLDLSEIKQLDIEAVLQGSPILTTGGVSYGMQPAAGSTEVLLLPHEDSVIYKPAKSKVARSYQLRQITGLPQAPETNSQTTDKGVTESVAGEDAIRETKQPEKRQQPVEKLNYRYVPFGVKSTVSPGGRNDVAAVESISLKAASQNIDGEAVQSTPERKEKKKKRKSKPTDGPSI